MILKIPFKVKNKYKMNDLHGELIPHIQNLFFEENR